MQMKKKFKTRKEADKFCYQMFPIVTHIYKGHRGPVVQWDEEIKSPLNADGKPRMSKEELHNRLKYQLLNWLELNYAVD